MPADLEPVPIRAQMVRVVDHPGRQPQHFALERRQAGEFVFGRGIQLSVKTAFEGAQHHQLPVSALILADLRPKIFASGQRRDHPRI